MNRIASSTLIGTAAILAISLGTCAPAFADGTSAPAPGAGKSLAAIQASAQVKTTARTGALNTSIAKINAAQDITASDRSTILATLNGDLAGMTAVEAKIAADTTAASAAADYQTIFTTYRVYAVAIPQSRFAAAADRLTSTTIPKLTDAQTKLAAALAGPDLSKSTPALLADLADMTTQISAATNDLNGVAASALAVTPAAFDANSSIMGPIRTSITTSSADLKKAASDAKTVLAAIK